VRETIIRLISQDDQAQRKSHEPLSTLSERPFRVLSLDGGGMRGVYTATYLACVADAFAKKRHVKDLDIGRAFDLIAGTSTGGILACALAAGVKLLDVIALYREFGRSIFSLKLPDRVKRFGTNLFQDHRKRPKALASGTKALEDALYARLGNETIAEMYARRQIALAITAVEMSQHRSWVFKTPHLAGTNHRDDKYRLVDVCLATSAAPIFRSLAVIEHPDGPKGYRVFADGGLWANNPVLVGLIDALEMTKPGRKIEIFSLGTCARPAGEQVPKDTVHRGLLEWRFGADAAALSIDAQEFAYDNMVRMLAKHVERDCQLIRFPREQIPAALMESLDLDETRPQALEALMNQARSDADMTNSKCGDPTHREGSYVCRLFLDMPEVAA